MYFMVHITDLIWTRFLFYIDDNNLWMKIYTIIIIINRRVYYDIKGCIFFIGNALIILLIIYFYFLSFR